MENKDSLLHGDGATVEVKPGKKSKEGGVKRKSPSHRYVLIGVTVALVLVIVIIVIVALVIALTKKRELILNFLP